METNLSCLFADVGQLERENKHTDAETILRLEEHGAAAQANRSTEMLCIRSRLAANLTMQRRFNEAYQLALSVSPALQNMIESNNPENRLVISRAHAEAAIGMYFQNSEHYAQAMEHFLTGMHLYDLASDFDASDPLTMAYEYLSSSIYLDDAQVNPIEIYVWSQHYLSALQPELHSFGARLLMWLGHLADLAGNDLFAHDMYIKAIAMARTAHSDRPELIAGAEDILSESISRLMELSTSEVEAHFYPSSH